VIVTDADREPSVVVDASAVAALVFGEPDAEAVAARLAGRPLIAPTLLRYEMVSVYLKKLRRYAAERSALSEMLRAYSQLEIQEVQPDTEEVARIAEETGLTAYDAAYLWLGQLIRAPVVTLDQRLAEVARGLGLPES